MYGNIFSGLLVSGASRSIIGGLQCRIWKTMCKLQKKPSISCTVVNGQTYEAIGTVWITLQLQNRTQIFELFAIPSLPRTLILGAGFRTEMEIISDLFSGEWSF